MTRAMTSTARRAATAALLLGTTAFAGSLAGGTGAAQAQGADLTEADRAFLVKEAHGASYELQSAKLAVGKASRQDVKDYAAKLVRDHETYNAALEKLGRAQGVTLPTDLDAADKAHMQELERASGKSFDDLYVKEASRINAEDKRDGAKEKAVTKSQPIKDFLASFDAMDEEHQKLAQKLEKAGG